MPALFAIALFVSALLLFLMQPMLAKMVLPFLGGTPAVWNTCMLFFQAMLLAGYAYAHWLANRIDFRKQVIIHVALLLLAVLALPVAIAGRSIESIPSESNPAWWLLGCLSLSAGLPFFAVATNAPLLQRWFSRSGHRASEDPYFLYAASNLGSLVALFSYPLVIEPRWNLDHQSRGWTAGFILLIALIFGCGLVSLWSGRLSAPGVPSFAGASFAAPQPPLRRRQRFRWCLLAFVPSSLMLGVTTYLTTDIASLPLLWVLPLALYLITFIWAFARQGRAEWRWAFRLLPIGAIGLAYMILSEATEPVWVLVVVHLAVFFLGALVCHGQLASDRPPAFHLTEFYLWISVGGVLGGLFNALVAPVAFTGVAEYPAALILACVLIPASGVLSTYPRARWLDLGMPLGIGLVTVLLAWGLRSTSLPVQARLGIAFGIPLLACYALVDRPLRFGLSLGCVLLVSSFLSGTHGRPLRAERNFFGVLRVTRDPLGPFYRLVHGNTIHGRQWIDSERRREPLSYYHCRGPLGQVFDVFSARPASTNVGVIGLGTGAMAGYAKPGEKWTFYEINPAVLDIANDTNYFTFLSSCPAGQIDVILGDARLRLRDAAPHQYGLLVLDAFSSDSIPLHLVTREALQLYLSKLAPGGLLAFHISNRCLELEEVLGDLAKDANLVCHAHDEVDIAAADLAEGKDQSHWLVMARTRDDLGRLARDARWLPIKGRPHSQIWTDDFSNLLSVFKWK